MLFFYFSARNQTCIIFPIKGLFLFLYFSEQVLCLIIISKRLNKIIWLLSSRKYWKFVWVFLSHFFFSQGGGYLLFCTGITLVDIWLETVKNRVSLNVFSIFRLFFFFGAVKITRRDKKKYGFQSFFLLLKKNVCFVYIIIYSNNNRVLFDLLNLIFDLFDSFILSMNLLLLLFLFVNIWFI